MTYADARGRQYVAIVATGGLGIGAKLASDVLVVFSLSGEDPGTLMKAPPTSQQTAPASQTSQPAQSAPLVSNHLPPGSGHDLTVRVCSSCHSPDVMLTQHLSEQEWSTLVQSMAARGAEANDDEFKQITDYLAKSFPRATMMHEANLHPEPVDDVVPSLCLSCLRGPMQAVFLA